MSFFVDRRNFAALNFLLLAFFVLASGGFQAVAQTAATDDGHQIEITLRPDKEAILLGEPTFLSFEIKNHSPQDLCVVEGGDYRNNVGRPDSFKVTVTGDDGKTVPQPQVALSLGGFIGCARIRAHGSHVVKLFLPHWATFETAGSYTVSVKKSLPVQNYSTNHTSTIGADVSASIKVIPADENKLGGIIDSLGAAMLDIKHPESGRSAQALAYVDDKRAINYFAQALERFGDSPFEMGEYFRSRQAAAALAHFNDDSALAALEAAMGSPNEETRLDVASAFERSQHPKAIGLLLKMRGDGYWFVRLRVAQGLGKVKSEESLAPLRELLQDENEDVRKAARDSLSARGQE